MEEAPWRLAVLCSHLRPTSIHHHHHHHHHHTLLSPSTCVSSSNNQRRLPDDDEKDEQRNQQYDCIFCRIIRGESPAFKLYEDDMCLCILDRTPVSHGHSLIIPKTHYPSLEATPPSVVAAMCSKVPVIGNAIMKATGSDSFNLLVNNGASAGQVIFHTHIHIIPRRARDCLWTTESLRRWPLDSNQDASKLVDCVREQLSNISEDGKDQDSSLA